MEKSLWIHPWVYYILYHSSEFIWLYVKCHPNIPYQSSISVLVTIYHTSVTQLYWTTTHHRIVISLDMINFYVSADHVFIEWCFIHRMLVTYYTSSHNHTQNKHSPTRANTCTFISTDNICHLDDQVITSILLATTYIQTFPFIYPPPSSIVPCGRSMLIMSYRYIFCVYKVHSYLLCICKWHYVYGRWMLSNPLYTTQQYLLYMKMISFILNTYTCILVYVL